MPNSDLDKVSVDAREDKPSLFARIFVFVITTLATVLTAVLVSYGIRALFNWIAG